MLRIALQAGGNDSMKKRKLMNLKIGHTENGTTLIEFLSNRLGVSRNKAKEIIDELLPVVEKQLK